MERIIINLHGKQAEVDKDQVKMLLKKESLVKRCMEIQYNPDMTKRNISYEEDMEIRSNVSKIIGLNRRIRPTVKYFN
ncbi:MAG TPA: hypothetical protein VFM18_02930 [Methanosarcina sp.]|nr:hypothetical protein [Methanosarcina sp.]